MAGVAKKYLAPIIIAFIAAVSLCFAVSGEAGAAMAYHSGWEGGNTFESYYVTGSPSVQSTTKHTGSYAMRCNTSGSAAYVAPAAISFEEFSSWIYIVTAPSAEVRIFGIDTAAKSSLKLTTDRKLNLYHSDTTLVASGTTQIPLETWTRISGSHYSTTSAKIYIDGNLEFSSTSAGQDWGFPAQLGICGSVTADIYFDDFVGGGGTTGNDLGDIRTLLSRPNAAGAYTEFNHYAGSATHYENVDDAPGSISDADYNDDTTNAVKRDSYGIQDCATIGIGGSDTINAVRSLFRMKRGASTTGSDGGMVRDNSTNYDSTFSLTTSFTWFSRYDAVMPNGGGTWTQTRIDALEAGFAQSVAGTKEPFGSALMVMVAFTPAAGGEPDISVSPTNYNFGTVAVSSTPYTATNYFTLTNSSSMQTDQTISVTTTTWSGGVTWTHSDTCTPGTNTAGLKANRGGTWGTGDVIVKYSSPNYIYENCPASTGYNFGLKLWAPTEFTDGTQKAITVRISAAAG